MFGFADVWRARENRFSPSCQYAFSSRLSCLQSTASLIQMEPMIHTCQARYSVKRASKDCRNIYKTDGWPYHHAGRCCSTLQSLNHYIRPMGWFCKLVVQGLVPSERVLDRHLQPQI